MCTTTRSDSGSRLCLDRGDRALTRLGVRVRAWAAWTPELATPAAWLAWADRTDAVPVPDPPAAAPLLLRRRVTPIGQHALRMAWSLPDVSAARVVFCSRHGEFGRTLSILNALTDGGTVSPADFTLSVHNALAGLLSIAASNRHGHTTIAAGEDSFSYGMMEALACLADEPDEPVVLVYFDERLPPPFDVFTPATGHDIAIALTLDARDGAGFTLATTPAPASAEPTHDPAMRFMRFLLGTDPELLITGDRLSWQWRRDDPGG